LAVAVARWTIAHTVTTHMAVGAGRAAVGAAALAGSSAATVATTASGFGVANALHHFTACCFGCGRHHVATWGLANASPQGLTAHGYGFGNFIGIRPKSFNGHHRHLLLGEDFDVANETLFIQRHQAHGFAA
jgi:hypothetical protein